MVTANVRNLLLLIVGGDGKCSNDLQMNSSNQCALANDINNNHQIILRVITAMSSLILVVSGAWGVWGAQDDGSLCLCVDWPAGEAKQGGM